MQYANNKPNSKHRTLVIMEPFLLNLKAEKSNFAERNDRDASLAKSDLVSVDELWESNIRLEISF